MRADACKKPFGPLKTTIVALATLALVATGTPQPANANLLGGALMGGLGGSLVGGLIGGRRGARAGALIGGVVGAARGAERSSANRYYAQRRAAQYAPPSYKRKTSTRAPAGAASSSTQVIEIQKALVRLGYNPGPIDGVPGGATRKAVAAYQRANGMSATGQSSDALLKHMLRNGG